MKFKSIKANLSSNQILKRSQPLLNKKVRAATSNRLDISVNYLIGAQERTNDIANPFGRLFNFTKSYWAAYGINIDRNGSTSYRCTERGTYCLESLSCPGNARMAQLTDLIFNGGFADGHRVVTVIVAGKDVSFPSPTLGCTQTFGNKNKFGVIIYLSRDAIIGSDPYILAHEIGHALYVTGLNSNNKAGLIDNSIPGNLMNKIVPIKNPTLTEGQINAARKSIMLY
ncbi:hypothetical protein LOZ80_14455 [Paenibacillus sp. HWE-109]|uniref:hypothetical protein n=1 Tax=Paenibacillus sp. HWE-109 TaxID=1306526 RepID=UPI001EDDAED6|nr:hypothetical protein [Paenibacillus sp. HWE-109]UKS30065.1 hypothetical protein LOZ80_14455 [Paenibacillus sp. HWE-109]